MASSAFPQTLMASLKAYTEINEKLVMFKSVCYAVPTMRNINACPTACFAVIRARCHSDARPITW